MPAAQEGGRLSGQRYCGRQQTARSRLPHAFVRRRLMALSSGRAVWRQSPATACERSKMNSRKYGPNHISVDIGQASLDAIVIKRQPHVIDSQQVQKGGVKIVNVHGILGRLPADLVRSAIGDAVS